jgi:hypothetical protein
MNQPNVKVALRIYFEKPRIGTKEIRELFSPIGTSKITELKNKAREIMKQRDIPPFDAYTIDTDCAYKAWGLDPVELEKRYQKLKKLEFLQ